MNNKHPPPHRDRFEQISPDLTRFIESLGRYFESYGIPRIGGRILGLLLVSHKPLSAEDMASILRVSRGSISTNFRLLLASGLAEKITYPGDRTTYYIYPPTAFEKVMKVEIEGIAALQKLGRQGLNALPSGHPARDRLEGLIEWTGLVDEVYQEVLTEWHERSRTHG